MSCRFAAHLYATKAADKQTHCQSNAVGQKKRAEYEVWKITWFGFESEERAALNRMLFGGKVHSKFCCFAVGFKAVKGCNRS